MPNPRCQHCNEEFYQLSPKQKNCFKCQSNNGRRMRYKKRKEENAAN